MLQRTEQAARAAFGAGLTAFVVAAAADTAVHLAGRDSLEPAVHVAIVVAMVVVLAGVGLRGIAVTASSGKERTRAHR